LINLLEIISNKSVGRYNKHPRIPTQKYENTGIAMKFIQSEGIKVVNIGNTDITDGNLKIILGLIWTLILKYQIKKGGSGDEGSAKNELLKWVQSKIPEYGITGFTKDWNDGKAINALINAIEPNLCKDHKGLGDDKLNNATKGIDTGFNEFGIPRVILPEEMVHPKVDEHAMMTYISYYRDLDLKYSKKGNLADRCVAYGPGLVEAIVGEDAPFVVETPGGGKLEIKVEGPKSAAPVKIKDVGNGKYEVSYKPTEVGEYKVHILYDGNHIPGSIFHVTVLENESLGGEGKILIFYSTTSARNERTRPLQELLERKKIHLRSDFEPWIPVDLMTPKDRDTVFHKAGTKNLPIVYIDDVYIGDLPRMLELEKSGELDRLLKYNEKK